MIYVEFTFPAARLASLAGSTAYHLEFTLTEEEAQDFAAACALPAAMVSLIVRDDPEMQP